MQQWAASGILRPSEGAGSSGVWRAWDSGLAFTAALLGALTAAGLRLGRNGGLGPRRLARLARECSTARFLVLGAGRVVRIYKAGNAAAAIREAARHAGPVRLVDLAALRKQISGGAES